MTCEQGSGGLGIIYASKINSFEYQREKKYAYPSES